MAKRSHMAAGIYALCHAMCTNKSLKWEHRSLLLFAGARGTAGVCATRQSSGWALSSELDTLLLPVSSNHHTVLTCRLQLMQTLPSTALAQLSLHFQAAAASTVGHTVI